MPYTHSVAVTAYIIDGGKFLLLKRNHHPRVWGPPGGRLHPDEDPEDGLHREVKEECNLKIEVIAPAGIWFGKIGKHAYLSIDYLARLKSGKMKLSPEHSEFMWSTIEDLRSKKPKLGGDSPSFDLKDFEKAWKLYSRLK
jgi:8-oxo-dGTP diphosphatase